MTFRSLTAAAVLAFSMLAGVRGASAQPLPDPALDPTAAPTAKDAPHGPGAAEFQVIPIGMNSAILLDAKSGQTWKLVKDADSAAGFVWLPIRQLATNMEIDQFQQRAAQRKKDKAKRGAGGLGEGIERPAF